MLNLLTSGLIEAYPDLVCAMNLADLLAVQPVHGWRTGDEELILPPKAFNLAASLDELAQGREVISLLRQPDHLLDGLWICLARRGKAWDGRCDLAVFRDRPTGMSDWPALFHGYANVDPAGR